MTFQARKALESDRPAIADVVMSAFGDDHGQEIVDLVADLLKDPSAQPALSLVATSEDRVVGHILFTSARVESSAKMVPASILAPLAVHPDVQSRGVGGQLIEAGLEQLRATKAELVYVLGHPGYYPKYGFAPAGIRGFEAPYPIPPKNADAWMVLELQRGSREHTSGRVTCAKTLDNPKHWRE